jgi:hypothetical protein
MNNYQIILMYLKQFEGDGQYHPIEQLFTGISLIVVKDLLKELEGNGLIKFKGRENRFDRYEVSSNLLTQEVTIKSDIQNQFNRQNSLKPLQAMLTFNGSKYLKEEIQMKENGKYNISVNGQGTIQNVVIESNNFSINSPTELARQIEEIVTVLRNDSTVNDELRKQINQDLQVLKANIINEVKIPNRLFEKILRYGSEVSSIGQLTISLLSSIGL